jgi:hypothetical protein
MELSGHAFGVPKDKLRAIRESRGGCAGPDRRFHHSGARVRIYRATVIAANGFRVRAKRRVAE